MVLVKLVMVPVVVVLMIADRENYGEVMIMVIVAVLLVAVPLRMPLLTVRHDGTQSCSIRIFGQVARAKNFTLDIGPHGLCERSHKRTAPQ